MTYIIQAPQQINSTIQLPASKSICNRALVIHAMAGCTFPLNHLSDCDDTEVIVAALRDMPETINIKAAGPAMRFMTAYLASTPGSYTITGTERMKNRPIAILVEALCAVECIDADQHIGDVSGDADSFENQSISLDFRVCCKSQRYAPLLHLRAVKMHHAHRALADTDGANQNEQNAQPDAFQNHL